MCVRVCVSMSSVCVYVCFLVPYLCVYECPQPLKAEGSSGPLCDQVTEVGVFPLSSVACMSASPSFFSASLLLVKREPVALRHPGLFLWHHYTPPLLRSPVFLFLSSAHLLTGSSRAAGPHIPQEAEGHVTIAARDLSLFKKQKTRTAPTAQAASLCYCWPTTHTHARTHTSESATHAH